MTLSYSIIIYPLIIKNYKFYKKICFYYTANIKHIKF